MPIMGLIALKLINSLYTDTVARVIDENQFE